MKFCKKIFAGSIIRSALFITCLLCSHSAFCQDDKGLYSAGYFNSLWAKLYNISSAEETMEVKREKTYTFLSSLIKQYPKDERNFMFIREAVNLTAKQLGDLIAMTDTALHSSVYRSGAVTALRRATAAETGAKFPSLTFTDTSGRTLHTDSLAGKIVFIDVWASWCGPCRKQIPDLVKLYKKYHARGFEIIGVSLDQKKEDWLSAIAKDKQTWPQFCEFTIWQNNKFATRFFIGAIPSNFLIDKNGMLLGQDLSARQVEGMVKGLLKNAE